jgi:hypothetical protein
MGFYRPEFTVSSIPQGTKPFTEHVLELLPRMFSVQVELRILDLASLLLLDLVVLSGTRSLVSALATVTHHETCLSIVLQFTQRPAELRIFSLEKLSCFLIRAARYTIAPASEINGRIRMDRRIRDRRDIWIGGIHGYLGMLCGSK